jgi:mRNA-degrading endonuclease RelE of RelBE toxin-antitoxin system
MHKLAERNPQLASRILSAVERYAETGLGDSQRLRGQAGSRLRVGTWRVIFDLDTTAREVIITTVGPRKDIYRE